MSVLPSLAPLMCAGVTVYTALKSGNLRPGDWVAVSGAGGGLGHLGVQYAKAMGYRVVALDVANKAALCREAGAEHFIDVTTFSDDEELCRSVISLTDGGARLALACSSSNRAYAQAISYLDVAGTLLCLGVPEGDPQPIQTASVARIVSRQLRIVGMSTRHRTLAYLKLIS
jgi:propanol-preferring alcohol dehydrogenase